MSQNKALLPKVKKSASAESSMFKAFSKNYRRREQTLFEKATQLSSMGQGEEVAVCVWRPAPFPQAGHLKIMTSSDDVVAFYNRLTDSMRAGAYEVASLDELASKEKKRRADYVKRQEVERKKTRTANNSSSQDGRSVPEPSNNIECTSDPVLPSASADSKPTQDEHDYLTPSSSSTSPEEFFGNLPFFKQFSFK